MATKREQMIETTRELLEAQGYCATGLNQILQESGAPRGSLYYYFPAGKDELIAEAIERSGLHAEERIRTSLAGARPAESIPAFIRWLAEAVERSGFQAGSITAVAYEAATLSERINTACQEAYQRWITAFAEALRSDGVPAERAERLASLLVSALEGSIVLSRTQRSRVPMDQVAAEIQMILGLQSTAQGEAR